MTDPGLARRLALFLLYAVVAVVLTFPVAAQSAIEDMSFEDRLGTVPVEVGVVHNGFSVVDTGALGSVYVARTGVLGLGLLLRVTGPPTAGGTLASYVDPAFVRANTATLAEPESVGAVYAGRLAGEFLEELWPRALLAAVVGGYVLLRLAHPVVMRRAGRRRVLVAGLGALGLLALSSAVALWQLRTWQGSEVPARLYAMGSVAGLSFDSPQIRELAVQVRPFVDKNRDRLERDAERYRSHAEGSIRAGVPAAASTLRPRSGEGIVVVEADPQGSQVGTDVRRTLYEELVAAVGAEALLARTVSGDVTSNGTVAEQRFVEEEVDASGELPVVAVKGDHDSEATVEQLEDAGADVPDREVVEVADLGFTGAADPEFKSLFGGSVSNPSGVAPEERGAEARAAVEEAGADPVRAMVHQNEAALGYLGLPGMTTLRALPGPDDPRLTRPFDDGVDDVPPGSLVYGHWHESDGPWVIWNTDGEEVTWTLVDQVGTSGGVEEEPTFNRFSTPYSPPLKPIELRLHYVDTESGLVTGFVSVRLSTSGELTLSRRTDVGVPLSR